MEGILDKFRQGGYADQAASWQSTGQNIPVSGSALQEVLGSGAIGQIAQQLGMSHGDAAGGLAQVLPQLIDQFTPNGEVPDNHDDMVAAGARHAHAKEDRLIGTARPGRLRYNSSGRDLIPAFFFLPASWTSPRSSPRCCSASSRASPNSCRSPPPAT